MQADQLLTVGIDVGGSAAKFALVDGKGRIVASESIDTGRDMPGDVLLNCLVKQVGSWAQAHSLAGIGVGVPATVLRDRPLDPTYCNVPALTQIDLAGELERTLQLPVWLENDAKAALRGEWCYGVARGARNAAIVTLGTGIGSALLLDGALREGAHGNHGELGLVQVGMCGLWRPLEQWAAPGVARDRFGADLPDLIRAGRSGDEAARAAVTEIFDHLGTAIANLHLLLDLELIVLAGGATALGPALVDPVAQAFAQACPQLYQFNLSIRCADYGPVAGAVGASALARMRLDEARGQARS